jgi:hypothetical protein
MSDTTPAPGPEPRTFRCEIDGCNTAFATRQGKNAHRRDVHGCKLRAHRGRRAGGEE